MAPRPGDQLGVERSHSADAPASGNAAQRLGPAAGDLQHTGARLQIESGDRGIQIRVGERVVQRQLAMGNARNGGAVHGGTVPFMLVVPTADIGESFRSFFDAVDSFVSNLASVGLVPLLISLACFTTYLSLRAAGQPTPCESLSDERITTARSGLLFEGKDSTP